MSVSDGCDGSAREASVDLRFFDFVVVVEGGDVSLSILALSAVAAALVFFFFLLLDTSDVLESFGVSTPAADVWGVGADGLAKMSSMSAFALTADVTGDPFCGAGAEVVADDFVFFAICIVFEQEVPKR